MTPECQQPSAFLVADRIYKFTYGPGRTSSPLRPVLSFRYTQSYYNQAHTHLALQKDAPLHRAVQRSGAILSPFRSWLGCITNTSGY